MITTAMFAIAGVLLGMALLTGNELHPRREFAGAVLMTSGALLIPVAAALAVL